MPEVERRFLDNCVAIIGIDSKPNTSNRALRILLGKKIGREIDTTWDLLKILFSNAQQFLKEGLTDQDYQVFFADVKNQKMYLKEVYQRVFGRSGGFLS